MIITDKKLIQIYDNWQDILDADEWYFNNSFESISKDLSSAVAFKYIQKVVNALLELEEEFLIWETLYFLMDLYRIADTTELHPALEKNWAVLREHIRKYEDSYSTPYQELRRLLRVKN